MKGFLRLPSYVHPVSGARAEKRDSPFSLACSFPLFVSLFSLTALLPPISCPPLLVDGPFFPAVFVPRLHEAETRRESPAGLTLGTLSPVSRSRGGIFLASGTRNRRAATVTVRISISKINISTVSPRGSRIRKYRRWRLFRETGYRGFKGKPAEGTRLEFVEGGSLFNPSL